MSANFVSPTLAIERPAFGQFARQVACIRTSDLVGALQEQQQYGGKIGEILCRGNLLTNSQRLEALRLQSRWVATALAGDMLSGTLPYATFLSVCMPAFNEANNIRSTLEAATVVLPELVDRFELVVVDDGSSDGTASEVEKFGQETGAPVRLIQHPVNRGYGAAVTSGLRAASGELVMFTDADGQFNLLDLPPFLAAMEQHDVAIGYRFDRAEKGIRKLNSWAWTKLVSCLLNIQVRDLDCAFKLFRRKLLDRLQLSAQGAVINAEIMTQCAGLDLNVCQLPVMHYPCYFGMQTGANLRVIARAFQELPRMLRYRFLSDRKVETLPSAGLSLVRQDPTKQQEKSSQDLKPHLKNLRRKIS